MSIVVIIALTIAQAITGIGFIALFKARLNFPMLLSLGVINGIALWSLVPFALELIKLELTLVNVFIAILLVNLVINFTIRDNFDYLRKIWREYRFRFKLYELPSLIVIGAIAAISVWRCFYLPPTPRDLTSGAEVIAEYAVREKTMINSVFTVNLETTNNQFKPPFITSLQIIYKYAGFRFGQLWLSGLFVFWIIFLYHALSLRLHRIISGILLIIFLAIPEMYAYSFMALFDYGNALFVFLSVFFLVFFLESKSRSELATAGFFMSMAVYTRSETFVLAVIGCLPLLIALIRRRWSFLKILGVFSALLIPAALIYFASVSIYIGQYLPAKYNVAAQVNSDLFDLKPLFVRFAEINTSLIFSDQGVIYYGYFFFFFIILLITDAVFSGRVNWRAQCWLYAVLTVYLGLAFLGYLLPLLDVDHSTKRGLFKIFPLMLLYMGSCNLFVYASEKIKNWEEKKSVLMPDVSENPGIKQT